MLSRVVFLPFYVIPPIPHNNTRTFICFLIDYRSVVREGIYCPPFLLRKIRITQTIKSSLSTWLKNTSRLGCPSGGFQEDLRATAGVTLKPCEGSFLKFHFVLMRLQNSSKSLRNSGSLIFRWIYAKSKPFSNTLISCSLKTLLLKLKTVSEQKRPCNGCSYITNARLVLL